MPGSTSNKEQLSAIGATQLLVSELTAEALNMKYNVVTAENKSIHSKRFLPGAWGNNHYYSVTSERVFPLDKRMKLPSSNIAPVTDHCIIPQLGNYSMKKLAESKKPYIFEVPSDADQKKSLYTPSKPLQQPSPIHIHLPSTYSNDGDDELDDNSSSLDAGADKDISENLKKDGHEVKSIQADRSTMSDSIEDFNKNRNRRNISCQRNILRNHIEKFQYSQIKRTQNQNKTHRLSTRRTCNDVDSSEIEPTFTSTSGEQLHDSETSDDGSDNYLGQVETTGTNNIMKVLVPEGGDHHKKSFSNDNFTEVPSLVTIHNAEPSDSRNNSDENGKLFLLSKTVLKTGNNLADSTPEVQYPDEFLATDCVSAQGEKVESGTVIDLCDAKGTDGSVSLIDEQQYQKNLADSKSHVQLQNSVKIKGNKTATTETIVRNVQRKLQKKNMHSNNKNTQTKLTEVHNELESSSEHGDLMCKSVVGVESSNKRSYSNTLNQAADGSIIARSHSKHGHSSIPVVTVDYEYEEDLKELKSLCLRNKINNMEVKTSELPEKNIYPYSVLAVYKSSREKNYYDVARRPTSGTVVRKCSDISEENSQQQDNVFKTTRTIEFRPQSPEPSSSKSIIQSMKQPKLLPVDYCSYEPQTYCLQEYEPVRIKKTRKRISSAPKKNPTFFFGRAKTTSAPDLFRSRPMVWTQNQRNKPEKNNRNISDNGKASSLMTYSHGTRISSAPSRSLKEPTLRDSLAEEIQAIQTKMARLGTNDGIKALEKALFSTSGKMVHSHAANYLPSDPSYGLIPHYKHWLPEEYTLLKTIKKKLDKDDHYKHLRSLRTAKKMTKLTVGDVEKIIRKA